MSDAVIVEPAAVGGSKRRQQILLGVLLLVVLVYAVPKVVFRDAGSSELQSTPTPTPTPMPAAETAVEESEQVAVDPPSSAFTADDGTGASVDLPVREREGKNPFEPLVPTAPRAANPGTAGIVPPAPVLPPAVAPSAPTAPGTVPPAPAPVFGAPPAATPPPAG